jgi:hypothetical protein
MVEMAIFWFQFHRKYYFEQEEEEMKLCLTILSVPWYMFNGLEDTAILNHFLTFITEVVPDYCASDFNL